MHGQRDHGAIRGDIGSKGIIGPSEFALLIVWKDMAKHLATNGVASQKQMAIARDVMQNRVAGLLPDQELLPGGCNFE